MNDEKGDLPKIVATAIVKVPSMGLRLGISYLRMKKRSQKAARRFTENLENEGVPPELARKLGEAYASELSIRKMMPKEMSIPFISSWRQL